MYLCFALAVCHKASPGSSITTSTTTTNNTTPSTTSVNTLSVSSPPAFTPVDMHSGSSAPAHGWPRSTPPTPSSCKLHRQHLCTPSGQVRKYPLALPPRPRPARAYMHPRFSMLFPSPNCSRRKPLLPCTLASLEITGSADLSSPPQYSPTGITLEKHERFGARPGIVGRGGTCSPSPGVYVVPLTLHAPRLSRRARGHRR